MSVASSMKRKRSTQEGLAAGERLKRNKLSTAIDIWASPWGWAGTDAMDVFSISKKHLMATCGFLSSSGHAFCKSKLKASSEKNEEPSGATPATGTTEDLVVVSDDDTPGCSKRSCKRNPNCLNHLGQDRWVDEEGAFKSFRAATKLGRDPSLSNRKPDLPVGLRNLGATCYANAYLQVWFQDVAFRNGVYRCLPPHNREDGFEDSPIFQLQTVFAAFQESKKRVFNPVKLVESLKLRTSEQQDAQEFSKLFMSHLDSEFQKQSDPELQNLLSRQFEGTQAYTTTCQRCKTCSSNDSKFLELELNLENNASLESRIQALLQPEILSGDNRYRCSHCDSLEDASRKVILRRLPPVLHFSLLRFVFDLQTFERKKSKHSITFATVLDMSRFIEGSSEEHIYELRGVLLHKGTSAYHGHYEAMVQEATSDAWFQFNDEVVTKIAPPGNMLGAKGGSGVGSKNQSALKKRKRVIDSEDEIELVDPPVNAKRKEDANFPSLPGSRTVSSKDAYMLVYTRRQTAKTSPLEPSSRAREVIAELNATHEAATKAYATKFEQTQLEFNALREKMLKVIQHWGISSANQPSVVASRRILEELVSRPFVSPSDKAPGESSKDPTVADLSTAEDAVTREPPSEIAHESRALTSSPPPDATDTKGDASLPPEFTSGELSVAEMVCAHGMLDPEKAGEMKRIDAAAYKEMTSSLNVHFSHVLTEADVCEKCVKSMFPEKLYQRQHPQHVAEFDKIRDKNAPGQLQYWISKKWIRDWRQARPKTHTPGRDDPGPSSEEFYSDVLCEHGNLGNSLTLRARISSEAYTFLQSLFPGWTTLPDCERACTTCMEAIELSRGEKQAMKKRAEDEKAQLKHMNDNALNGNTALLEDLPQAVVPASFIREWRHWHIRPASMPRPLAIDNSPFFCEHNLLAFDPNQGDIDETMCIIRRLDWDTLQRLYDAGPAIFLSRHTVGGKMSYRHEPTVCHECRVARKSAYDVTEITVRVLADGDPLPTPETYHASANNSAPAAVRPGQATLPSYASRQSKRLRTGTTKRREHRLTISKGTTVKALKLQISDELQIPTICQRLFRAGEELLDNTLTLGVLGVLARDVLELREEREDEDLLDADADGDADRTQRRRRDEGRGFGGTLLGGDLLPSDSVTSTLADSRSASERPSSPPADAAPERKACSACTLLNPFDAVSCTVCDTPLR